MFQQLVPQLKIAVEGLAVRAAFAKSDTGADQKSGTADTGLFIWSLIKSASYKLVNLFDLLFTKLL